ncbi:MAG: zinc ribbon domain-containing protein, partial [Candidatus Nitrosopolaris sp.]
QYYKLTQYITYKAALAGIKVIQVSERWTSQYCRRCYQKGVRNTEQVNEINLVKKCCFQHCTTRIRACF